ncbi:MAG: penicillin-binding protein 2 [Myxococcales bacterium]|nr:penicillin-binding protein 2 [Myxococcales bacterium]
MSSIHKPEDLRSLKPRLQAMVVVVMIAFTILLGRLCQLQVLDGDHYARKAERNFVDEVIVEAPRGRIFDARSRPLATNRPAYTLYVTPRPRVMEESDEPGAPRAGTRVPIDDDAIEELTSLITFVDDDDRAKFQGAIRSRREDKVNGIYATAIRSNLSWEEYAQITARESSLGHWVEIRESARRFYPRGALTAFVTGYVGEITPEGLENARGSYRPGDRVGKTGIERQWENYLRGRLGKRSRVVDARRRTVADPPPGAIAALPPDEDPIPGQDIYLSLDLELQRAAENAFEGVHAGAVVALEPDTGRILAMLSVPAIDPNHWQQPIPRELYQEWVSSPFKPFIDRTIQEHFFPGSTYKVVSALAALSDPTFDPEREIPCERYVRYGGRRFKCTHKHGPVDLHMALVQSCNVYFYTLAMEEILTLDRMEVFARRLGLGERTGLGLNSEVKGRIPTEAFEAREGTYQRGVRLNSAIGQGNVTATVLQLAVLYGALANGGRVMTPYLVDRIETHDHKLVFKSAPQQRAGLEPVANDDRDRIHAALIGVVNDELGTAYSERPETVTVAGKTGTAQVAALDRRRKKKKDDDELEIEGWDTTKDHAWFAGYAPADQPKIAVAALVEHGGVGADAAAPIVMHVIDTYLASLEQQKPDQARRRRPAGVPPPLPGQRRPNDGVSNRPELGAGEPDEDAPAAEEEAKAE